MRRNRASNEARRSRVRNTVGQGAAARITAAAMALALVAVACGSGDGENSGALGSGVPGDQEDRPVDAVTDGSDGERSDPETSGDVDENGGTGPEDSGAVSEDGLVRDPLPAANSLKPFVALVADIHGPIDDITAQVNRLTAFPSVPTPSGTTLVELAAGVERWAPDERARTDVALTLTADEGPEQIWSMFDETMLADGWNLDGTSYNPDQFIEDEHERRTYRRPIEGDDFREEKLDVTVIDRPLAEIELAHSLGKADDELVARFRGLAGDDAPIPPGAHYLGVRFSTRYGPGLTGLSVASSYAYDDATDPTREGILAEVESIAEAGPHPIGNRTEYEVQLEIEGLDLARVTATDGAVRFSTDQSFATPGSATPEDFAPDQAVTGLPPAATPENFKDLMIDVRGQTADLSAQMRRLGPFPDLPTPKEATILDVRSGLSVKESVPGLVNAQGEVTVAVAGQYADIDAFYRAQAVAAGWVLNSTRDVDLGEGVQAIEHTYDHPDVVEANGAPLRIQVVDAERNAQVEVTISYNEYLPADQVDWDRWSGWEGSAPVPEGGELVAMSISTFAWFGEAAWLTAIYAYPEVDWEDREDLIPEIEAASTATDYTRNPDGDADVIRGLAYTHPFFDQVEATADFWDDVATVNFQAGFTFDD